MTARTSALCSHCSLPVGTRGTERNTDGGTHAFCCYGCALAWQVGHGNTAESEATWLLIRLGVGAFLAMNIKMFSMLLYFGAFDDGDAHLLPFVHALLWVLATPMLFILGWPFARDAWHEARRRQLTANTLMTVGVSAAYGYSAIAVLRGEGEVYFDTVALLLVLFTLGRLLEAAARARAVRSLVPILEAERLWVTLIAPDGTTRPMRAGELMPGMRVQVLPGARIPVDGTVLAGRSHVDESVLTGEARPIAKQPGSKVLSGSINHEGCLTVEAGVAGCDARWARICRAVQDTLARRSVAERLTDRAAGMFVPLVMLLAAGTVLYWNLHLPLAQALFAGLAVLVVACPCALGLAAPLATTLGIGGLVQRGILVRSPEVLEELTRARVIVFDKTGTLTMGRLHLTAIVHDAGTNEDELLQRAAALERDSEHPLARAVIQAAAARAGSIPRLRSVRARPGLGITGLGEDGPVVAGSAAIIDACGWKIPAAMRARIAACEDSGQTLVHVGWGARWRGVLVFGDAVLSDAARTLDDLRAQGLHLVLLTGDLPAAARQVADLVGVDEWHAQQSPDDKVAAIDRLARKFGPVVMVGDGLNDGPVLAAANVGIAVGSATDLARETAEMTLPPGGLHLLPSVLQQARRVRRTILTNLVWAFGYNGLALALAAAGYLSPVWAALIMAGSSLLVIANSMRLDTTSDRPGTGPLPLSRNESQAPRFRAARPDSQNAPHRPLAP